MDHVLFVTSSAFGSDSRSRRMAEVLVEGMRRRRPQADIRERHLDPATMPHLTGKLLVALSVPASERTAEQRRITAFADELIGEVEVADTIVVASPMYNHTVSPQRSRRGSIT